MNECPFNYKTYELCRFLLGQSRRRYRSIGWVLQPPKGREFCRKNAIINVEIGNRTGSVEALTGRRSVAEVDLVATVQINNDSFRCRIKTALSGRVAV